MTEASPNHCRDNVISITVKALNSMHRSADSIFIESAFDITGLQVMITLKYHNEYDTSVICLKEGCDLQSDYSLTLPMSVILSENLPSVLLEQWKY